MDISKISIGPNPPHDINVIIEIPLRGEPVKYEICKESGAMFVDRFLHTAMFYPANYGFVPHTLSDDGDPIDVLVVGRHSVAVGSVMRSRPVGVLMMEDEAGLDEKILAVPHPKLHPFYDNVQTYLDLPQVLLQQIEHFFVHYKDLEPGKWAKMRGWGGPEKAMEVIEESIRRAEAKGV